MFVIRKKNSENSGEKLTILFFLQQNCDFFKTVSLIKVSYFAFLYQSRQIKDIVHFSCDDINATNLAINTTFNLCSLWVTDTMYRNKRLINLEIKFFFTLRKMTIHLLDLPYNFLHAKKEVKT